MSSGEQTCQHLPLGRSLSPSALTPQTICSGLQGQGDGTQLFCTDPGATFVSHDCLSLADCLSPYVIAGKIAFYFWGRETQNSNAEFGQFSKNAQTQG